MRRLVRYKPSRLQITAFFVGTVVRKDAAGTATVARAGAVGDEKKGWAKGGRGREAVEETVDLSPLAPGRKGTLR